MMRKIYDAKYYVMINLHMSLMLRKKDQNIGFITVLG